MIVLLSAVGNRDPFASLKEDRSGPNLDDPGPVLSGVERIRPDVVYLLPTDKIGSIAERARATADEIRRRSDDRIDVTVLPLSLPDPTDYRTVVPAFRRAVRRARTEQRDDATLHVLLSSGAPQFRLAWALLLLGGDLPAKCWEVRDPRFPGDRVWEADIRFLEEPALHGRFHDAWTRCDFPTARQVAREWSERAAVPEERKRARWLQELMRGYTSWDAVDWNSARECVGQGLREGVKLHLPSPLLEQLKAQQQALDEIINLGEVEGFWNLADLYHNACRRFQAGYYVDALARYRRLIEGTANAVLRAHGCAIEREWTSLSPEAQRVWARVSAGLAAQRQAAWHAYGRNDSQERVALGLPEALHLAAGLAGLDRTSIDSLLGYTDHRNRSIAAHGMQPVSRRIAKRALDRMHDLLTAAAPAPIDLDAYPFSLATLTRLEATLVSVLRETEP